MGNPLIVRTTPTERQAFRQFPLLLNTSTQLGKSTRPSPLYVAPTHFWTCFVACLYERAFLLACAFSWYASKRPFWYYTINLHSGRSRWCTINHRCIRSNHTPTLHRSLSPGAHVASVSLQDGALIQGVNVLLVCTLGQMHVSGVAVKQMMQLYRCVIISVQTDTGSTSMDGRPSSRTKSL